MPANKMIKNFLIGMELQDTGNHKSRHTLAIFDHWVKCMNADCEHTHFTAFLEARIFSWRRSVITVLTRRFCTDSQS